MGGSPHGNTPQELRIFERALANLEAPVYGAFVRVCIGGMVIPVWRSMVGETGSGLGLAIFFSALLTAIRVVPIAVRRILPFSPTLRMIWSERRQLAKRFDSYQWQKLFWMGCGLTGWQLLPGGRADGSVPLTAFCLVSGLLGLGVWRHRVKQLQDSPLAARWIAASLGRQLPAR